MTSGVQLLITLATTLGDNAYSVDKDTYIHCSLSGHVKVLKQLFI